MATYLYLEIQKGKMKSEVFLVFGAEQSAGSFSVIFGLRLVVMLRWTGVVLVQPRRELYGPVGGGKRGLLAVVVGACCCGSDVLPAPRFLLAMFCLL